MSDEDLEDRRPKKAQILGLEKKLKETKGPNRWRIQHDLVWAYYDGEEYAKAIGSYEACKDMVPEKLKSELIIKVSEVLEDYGEFNDALAVIMDRISLLEDRGDGFTKEMASLQLRYAQILRRQGRFEEAMEHCQLSLAIHTEWEVSLAEQAGVLSTMGLMMWEQGNYPMAFRFMHQALEKGLEAGIHEKVKWYYNNLGLVNYQLSNYDEALRCYEKATEHEKRGNRSFLACVDNNIGLVHHDKGDYPRAREYYIKSLVVNEEIENLVGVALSTMNLGLLAIETKDIDEGRDNLERSASLCRHMKERWINALVSIGLARVWFEKGDLRLSRLNAERALDLAAQMRAKESKGMALRELARIEVAEEDLKAAKDHFEESEAIFSSMENRYELSKSLLARGKFLLGSGEDAAKGRLLLEKALFLAQDIGASGIIEQVKETIASI